MKERGTQTLTRNFHVVFLILYSMQSELIHELCHSQTHGLAHKNTQNVHYTRVIPKSTSDCLVKINALS